MKQIKKLLILVLAIVLYSCGRAIPKNGFVVGKIKSDGIFCKYIMKATSGSFMKNAAIVDTCGKWNIGDTIKFVK